MRARLTFAIAILAICSLAPLSAIHAQVLRPRSGTGLAVVGDFFDLAFSDAGGAETSSAGGGTGGALDVLHGDVVDYSDKLCRQLKTAKRGDVDKLDSEYGDFRREQEAELDRIAAEEKALDEIQKQLDAGDGQAGTAGSPRKTKTSLEDAQKDLSRLRTQRKELVSSNELLIGRRTRFDAARAQVRQSESEIDRLSDEKNRLLSGETRADADLLGGFSAAKSRESVRQELQRGIDRENDRRNAALVDIGDALQISPNPKSLDDMWDSQTGSLKGTLYREWQAYRDQLAGLDTRIAEAEATEQAARTAGDQARPASGSEPVSIEDYRRRMEELIVARTAALLSYQLYESVTGCIRKRVAELKQDSQKPARAANWRMRFYITDTCYGPPHGKPRTIVKYRFSFNPEEWRSIYIEISPEREIHAAVQFPLFRFVNSDQGKLARLTRRKLAEDGSFVIEFVDPSPREEDKFYRRLASGELVKETRYPYRLEGRLVPDPDAPAGWVGSGSGQALYRFVGKGRYGELFHDGEPCNFTWGMSPRP